MNPDSPKFYVNKAGYTATKVACGWAGAIFEVTRPFGQEQWGQRNKIIKKSKVWQTNRPTDQPTNRPTDKAGCRVACTRLKICLYEFTVTEPNRHLAYSASFIIFSFGTLLSRIESKAEQKREKKNPRQKHKIISKSQNCSLSVSMRESSEDAERAKGLNYF